MLPRAEIDTKDKMGGWLRTHEQKCAYILRSQYLVGGPFSSVTISFTVVFFFLGTETFVLTLSSCSINSRNDTDTGLELGEKLFLEKIKNLMKLSQII